MNLAILVTTALWAGLFAMAMAVIFSAPRRALLPALCCGFVARFSRDLFVALGANQILCTAIAAGLVVIVAIALVRRPGISPVVVLTGLIPLGASGAFSNAIVRFLQISSLKGDALTSASLALVFDLSRVFTTTLAIAAGAWLGLAILRIFAPKLEANVELFDSDAVR